jgi:hypothetical protein
MPCIPCQLYFTCLEVYSSRGCATKNIHFVLKHPVTMNSVFLSMIPPSSHFVRNYGCPACIIFTSQAYALFIFLLTSPGCSRLLPWAPAKPTAHRTNTHCIMATSQNIRKGTQSGRSVALETQSLMLINKDPEIRASFEQFRCMAFCRKIQGFNMRLAEQFTLSFDGFHAVISGVTFQVIEETLLTATEIPLYGKRWFKGMTLDAQFYEYFIKQDCLGGKIETCVPSRYLQDPFRKLLGVIRIYFTCEGRFDRIHSHHIRLLMHFIGRRPLNLLFFLHQNLREMVDSAQAEAGQSKRKLFHVSLIKLLVFEELIRLGSNWDSFFLTAGIPKDPKGDFPLHAEKVISHHAEVGVEEGVQEGKMLESMSPQQKIPQRRGRPKKNKEAGETRVPSEPRKGHLPKNYLCASFSWNLLKVQAEKTRAE